MTTEQFLNDELARIETSEGQPTELLAQPLQTGVSILNPADFPNLDDAETGAQAAVRPALPLLPVAP